MWINVRVTGGWRKYMHKIFANSTLSKMGEGKDQIKEIVGLFSSQDM
jgi:hypothetical protein